MNSRHASEFQLADRFYNTWTHLHIHTRAHNLWTTLAQLSHVDISQNDPWDIRPIGRRWSPFLPPSARHQFTLPNHSSSRTCFRCVCLFPNTPSFADTHCIYTWRDGQAELTGVAGYIPRCFTHLLTVTHPSINQAWYRLVLMIGHNMLTTTRSQHVSVMSKFLSKPSATWANSALVTPGYRLC